MFWGSCCICLTGQRQEQQTCMKMVSFKKKQKTKLYSHATHTCTPSKSFSLINQAGGPHHCNEFIDTVITVITGDCLARAGILSPSHLLFNGLMAPVMSLCIPVVRWLPGCRSWRHVEKFSQCWPAAMMGWWWR